MPQRQVLSALPTIASLAWQEVATWAFQSLIPAEPSLERGHLEPERESRAGSPSPPCQGGLGRSVYLPSPARGPDTHLRATSKAQATCGIPSELVSSFILHEMHPVNRLHKKVYRFCTDEQQDALGRDLLRSQRPGPSSIPPAKGGRLGEPLWPRTSTRESEGTRGALQRPCGS